MSTILSIKLKIVCKNIAYKSHLKPLTFSNNQIIFQMLQKCVAIHAMHYAYCTLSYKTWQHLTK